VGAASPQPDAAEPVDGLLLVDKPQGWTSHDVVAKMRRILGTRKVGHGGTLDPMATGLLVIAAGRATRLLTYYSAHDKDYTATIRLGQSTVTDDAEGEVISSADATGVTRAAIENAATALTGDILQRPSAVSAIKVDGERAYARVRAGEDVELAARPVTVARFEVLAVRPEGDFLDVDVVTSVSSGTYIRALARDMGESLGVGGHLTALRRTRIGGLSVDGAVSVDGLAAAVERGDAPELLSLADSARAVLPTVEVTDRDAVALGYGQALRGADFALTAAAGPHDFSHDALAVTSAGVAVAIVRQVGSAVKPAIVFEPSQRRAE